MFREWVESVSITARRGDHMLAERELERVDIEREGAPDLGPGAVGLVQEYAGGYPAALWMQVAIMSLAIFALTRLGPPPRGTGVD